MKPTDRLSVGSHWFCIKKETGTVMAVFLAVLLRTELKKLSNINGLG
jgi:hypothetical protein